MYISDHFNINEANKSHVALRNHIHNQAPENLNNNLEIMAQNILEPIRDEYGEPFSPQSWYRSAELNNFIGGAKNSFHTQGLAVDLELLGWDNYDFAIWCSEYLDYDKIILEYYQKNKAQSGWVHIQLMPNPDDNRGMFLTFDGNHYERLI